MKRAWAKTKVAVNAMYRNSERDIGGRAGVTSGLSLRPAFRCDYQYFFNPPVNTSPDGFVPDRILPIT